MSEETTTGNVTQADLIHSVTQAFASEIFRLIEEDGLKGVADFSELHDHVDANDYIIQAFETTFGREIDISNVHDEAFANSAIEQVNEWLHSYKRTYEQAVKELVAEGYDPEDVQEVVAAVAATNDYSTRTTAFPPVCFTDNDVQTVRDDLEN